MIDRRQALRFAGLAAAGVALGACGTTEHPTATPMGASVTCPDPTVGSVTGESGSISGVALDFVDAAAIKQGVDYQWQWFPLLSTKPSVGAHYRAAQTVQNEKWLMLTVVGGHVNDPTNTTPVPPPATATLQVGQSVYEGTPGDPGYRVYVLQPNYASHSSNCKQTTKSPTSGSVTYTKWDDTGVEGSYDLYFGTDHITGTFVAPQLQICDPRPTKTCIAG